MGKDNGPKYLRQEAKVKVLVAQWCLTLCHLMDCSLPGSSVHGILQASILEWLALSFSTFTHDSVYTLMLVAGSKHVVPGGMTALFSSQSS